MNRWRWASLIFTAISLWFIGPLAAQSTAAKSDPVPSPAVTKAQALNPGVASAPNPGVASAPNPGTRRAPNPVVVPPYRAQIRAAHRVHAAQTQLACEDCHDWAKKSENTKDWLGPRAAICERCHGIRHDELSPESPKTDEKCAQCHLPQEALRTPQLSNSTLERRPSARLLFSHRKHAVRKISCQQCHGNVALAPDAEGSERLPLKPNCLRCHRGQGTLDGEARATCITCHFADGGRMQTRFGTLRLYPTSASKSLEHSSDFRRTHRFAAVSDARRCAGCHTERDCQDCHDGRLRPRDIHPADWQTAHGIASKQGENCSSCHRLQSFCLSCHQRVGIVSSGAPQAMDRRGGVHPPASVWITGPRGGSHHGTAARRNMMECVSCHQERDCIRCHAVGAGISGQSSPYGSGLNPHPPSFASQCRSYYSRNPRPCLACHRPDGSEIQRCR
jgi:hypothetical protein